MKQMKSRMIQALALVALCSQATLSQAIPINDSTVDYNGALFTTEGEWTDPSTYSMTYWANFAGYEGTGDQSFLRAIDWKWEGAGISSVSLLEAPGSTDDWMTQAFYQIAVGESVGCEKNGGSNAICTEYIGAGAGLSTDSSDDFRWLFEITFKNVRQQDLLLDSTIRSGYVNNNGGFASPLVSCSPGNESVCSSFAGANIVSLQSPGTADAATVPIPGVPALLFIGLAGLLATRRRPCAPPVHVR